MFKTLSIIIPVYNEEGTIFELLDSVSKVELMNAISKEIIVVCDHSTDGSRVQIRKFIEEAKGVNIQLVTHNVNLGKGGAIHSGIEHASGEYIIIQDADLELDPNEFNLLLAPLLANEADIIFGSRFMEGEKKGYKLNKVANIFLTWFSNIIFRVKLTDMNTCYKLVPSPLFKALQLKEKRFGFDPEITARLTKHRDLRIKEVPISYIPRTNELGKKIGWQDGIRALYCIIRYGWFTRKQPK